MSTPGPDGSPDARIDPRLAPAVTVRGRRGSAPWLVALALVVLAYVVAALMYARSADSRGLQVIATPPPGGVAITLEVVGIDPETSSARVRVRFEPAPDLVDDVGRLVREIRVVATLQGRDELDFPAGQRPGVVEASIYLHGASEDYPLDRWVGLFVAVPVVGSSPSTQELPSTLGIDSSLPGWRTTSITLADLVELAPDLTVSPGQPVQAFRFSRAGSTLAIVGLVLGLMVVLAALGMAVAVAVARGRRRLEPTLTGFLAALVFALIPLRNVLPGAPPLGAWIDILVFFWVEIVLMTALAVYVATWLRRGPPPSPPG